MSNYEKEKQPFLPRHSVETQKYLDVLSAIAIMIIRAEISSSNISPRLQAFAIWSNIFEHI